MIELELELGQPWADSNLIEIPQKLTLWRCLHRISLLSENASKESICPKTHPKNQFELSELRLWCERNWSLYVRWQSSSSTQTRPKKSPLLFISEWSRGLTATTGHKMVRKLSPIWVAFDHFLSFSCCFVSYWNISITFERSWLLCHFSKILVAMSLLKDLGCWGDRCQLVLEDLGWYWKAAIEVNCFWNMLVSVGIGRS